MSATMKALRKTKAAKGLEIQEVPVPSIGALDVLVRVSATSICGTDLHIYGWDRWSQGRIKPPVTLGHEFCGIVERVGEDVTAVKPGDFVSAEMHVNCGHCHQCRLGEAHICQNLKIIGIDLDGAFAEFVKIPATNIWKLDEAIPEHYAAILDPLGNAVHTVLAGAIAGQTVLVTGCGPIGLMSIAVAKACGSSTVFATETNEHRRAMAEEMGADHVINPLSENPVKKDSGCDGRYGCGRAPGNERTACGDSARVQGIARGRASVAAGHSYGKRAAGPGAGRDFQRRDRSGNLRTTDVRHLGADDGAAEGRAREPGAIVRRTHGAGRF